MKLKGSDLEFISQVRRDGNGVDPVSDSYVKLMENEKFKIHCLSMSERTFIAFNFNAFIVKIKTDNRLI